MRKIFVKSLLINISLLLIAFWAFNTYMIDEITDYLIQQKEDSLITQSQMIERSYYGYLSDGVVNYEKLSAELNATERFLDTKIAFFDRNGVLFIATNGYRTDSRSPAYAITQADLDRVFEGKILIKRSLDIPQDGQNFLVVLYPVKYFDNIHFALLMEASLPEIERTISEIRRITFFALLVFGVFVFFMNFFSIRRLTNNINEINRGILEITKGNYEESVNLYRRDELGDLARNYNSMIRDLKKYEEMRKNFVSNISHDMRTPLTTITGFVQGIKDGTIPREDEEKYLDLVLEEAKRLIRMTNDILDLSNVQAGGMQYRMAPFDLNGIVLNVLESNEKRILDKELELSVDLQERMPNALGDEARIQRVIYNLVDNAIKFSDLKGRVTIRTWFDQKLLYFSIENFGEIISMEDLPLVFNRFTKLDPSRGKNKSGSGLGLSISKEIMKGHQQDIYVESSPENGVRFTISLSPYNRETTEFEVQA